jgi:hypothetical protein
MVEPPLGRVRAATLVLLAGHSILTCWSPGAGKIWWTISSETPSPLAGLLLPCAWLIFFHTQATTEVEDGWMALRNESWLHVWT